MDEPTELSDAQVEELRANLLALQGELRSMVAATAEGAKPVELDQARVGRLSRMDAIQVQQMAKASERAQALRLQQVSQALRRLADHEYGYCVRCEEPIGYRRLEARPETPFCVRCQGARERK
jgi:DnaK suppressor protein